MIKRKNIIKIAIDSPAAAGAGTLAKSISKHYNLFYLDTGKIYRFIAYLKLKFPKENFESWLQLHNVNASRVFGTKVTFEKMKQAAGFELGYKARYGSAKIGVYHNREGTYSLYFDLGHRF